MNISLPQHFRAFVDRQVESGRYSNSSEVIRAGLRLLEDQDRMSEARLAALRSGIEIGVVELDAGQGRAFDAKKIKSEGRARLASRRK